MDGLLPPDVHALLAAFKAEHRPRLAGAQLSVGARALSKHVHRSSGGYWARASGLGPDGLRGSQLDNNQPAERALRQLLAAATLAKHTQTARGARDV